MWHFAIGTGQTLIFVQTISKDSVDTIQSIHHHHHHHHHHVHEGLGVFPVP